MQFDDRLATVLRMRADSDAALRTQFRQLLDLLGTAPADQARPSTPIQSAAYLTLGTLLKAIPQEEQSRILRAPGLRLRNPELVRLLANGEAKPAASVMATARLSEDHWLELIPTLPVNARGFLRHRRDLSPPVKRLLVRLGVQDLVLPDPQIEADDMPVLETEELTSRPAEVPVPATPPTGISEDQASSTRATDTASSTEVGAILRRIEEFREQRATGPVAPRLPLGEEELPVEPLLGFEFASDAGGTVHWASGPIAPLAVGLRLTAARPGPLIEFGGQTGARLAAHQPIHSMPVRIDAAPDISGEWRLDAAPLFDRETGSFTGYRGCLRRPALPEPLPEVAEDGEGDLMRQVLHELRTPVNAIQGFAEIIQQQLFGPAPHEYRAHAAAISVDAAKLLAGFDEVDRLVKLDSGALDLEPGETDMREIVSETVQRLQSVLRPRNAGFRLKVKGSPFSVSLDRTEALALCWRLLATAAGALAPGEEVTLKLSSNGKRVRLRFDMPRSLTETSLLSERAGGENRQRAVSAGMFGPDFAFRLAQAEAEAAGGKLKCKEDRVSLHIPVLTASGGETSASMGLRGG